MRAANTLEPRGKNLWACKSMAPAPDTQALLEAINSQSDRTSGEIQTLATQVAAHNARQEVLIKKVNTLDREILRGHSGRPSMRSQVDLIDHRVGTVEGRVGKVEDGIDEAGSTQKTQAVQLQQTRLTNRAKVVVAMLGLVGLLATAVVTYAVASPAKAKTPPAASGKK